MKREFDALFRTYYSVISTAAYNRLNDLNDAEDVASAVFSAAWRRRHEEEDTFTLPWLYSTLRNLVGNEYRRRTRTLRRVERLVGEAGAGSSTHVANDEHEGLRSLIASMEPADRELIWMAYWEELTREEMAVLLGCSEGAVRVRLLRARKKLSALMRSAQAVEGVNRP